MSSTFEVPRTARRVADVETRIIHFDATERRREKMRRAAAADNAAPPVSVTPPALKTAPVAKPAARPAEAGPWQAPPASAMKVAVKPAAAGPAPSGFAPAKPAAPASVAARTGASTMDAKALETFLVGFVVEQTGYPAEMVELDADLEADLGIDSIKKAQLFGELAEHFEVTQSAGDLSLDDFPTLRHVLNFLKDKPSRGSNGAATNGAAMNGAAPNGAMTNGVHTTHSSKAGANGATAHVATNGATNGVHAPAQAKPSAAPVKSTPTAPAPVAAAPAAKAAGMGRDALEKFLVNFVVEQTGYPAEMVELDADLEADLGIDSIKKAQLFGELAEHFEVTSSASDLSLDDFPTLRHVCNFLADKPARGAAAPVASAPATTKPAASTPAASTSVASKAVAAKPAAPAPKPAPVAAASVAPVAAPSMPSAELESFLVNFVVEQTGYPPEMVELDADLEADLGIDSIKKAQLFGELAEHFEVSQSATDLSLDDFPTLRHVLNFLAGVPRRG